jgi:hypothetical protein
MSVSLSLNDKIVIRSNNEEYDNIHATITFLNDKFFRAYTTMHADFLLSLDPFDEKYEITYIGLLKKAESDNYIQQNGIQKNSYVVYRIKNNTNANFAEVINIDNSNIVIKDISTSEEYEINLQNGINPEENIYYITHISKSRIPKGLFKNEEEYIDLDDLEDVEEEISDDFILYEDNVQQIDFINDLLTKNEPENDAIYQAGISIYLKNKVLVTDLRKRNKNMKFRSASDIPIIEDFHNKNKLPSWISISPKDKRNIFTIDENEEAEFDEITNDTNILSTKYLANTPEEIQEYENIGLIYNTRNPSQVKLSHKTSITYPKTDVVDVSITGKDMDSSITSRKFVDLVLLANETVTPEGFVVNYYKSVNDLKDNEYCSLYEVSKTNYIPRKLETLKLKQTRISIDNINIGDSYTFCIQQGDLGSPHGFIFSAKILTNDENSENITVEPINPELKKKLPSIQIRKHHLEIYGETENVSCIHSIIGKQTYSKNLENLIATNDIYLKMYPVNTPHCINSRKIFQYLSQMNITRRNLHYGNYSLFKQVLSNNQSNFKKVMKQIFTNNIPDTNETIKPLISSNAFPTELISSKQIKDLYPDLQYTDTTIELLYNLVNYGFDQGQIYILMLSHIHQKEQLDILRNIHITQQSKKEQLQSELSSLNEQIKTLRTSLDEKLRKNVNIVKEYASIGKMNKDKLKEFVLRDFKYDDVNKNLFEMIINENPDMKHDEHRRLLINRLQEKYNREPTELEIQSHILGGTPLQIGEHVLLKNKNEMKIFTYQGKDNDFILVDTSNIRKDDPIETCLYGDMDIQNMDIQSLRDSSQEIVYKQECITRELLDLEKERENLEEGVITKELLDLYTQQLNAIKSSIAILPVINTINKPEFNIEAIERKEVNVLPLSSSEKIPVDLEELDTTDEYTRDGGLRIRRTLNVEQRLPNIPDPDASFKSKYFAEFLQTFEDIFEVNLRVEDIEYCYGILIELHQIINRNTILLSKKNNVRTQKDRMNIYLFFFLSGCAASLIFTLQKSIPPYKFNYKVGKFSFTQNGYPLIDDAENQTDGIITSMGQFLQELKPVSKELQSAYRKKRKAESWIKIIHSFINHSLLTNPLTKEHLKRKKLYLERMRKPVLRFKSLPIGESGDYRIEDNPSPINNTNIMINKYLSIKQNITNFNPILITSLEEPYLANSISYYKPNEKPEIFEVLSSLNNIRPYDFYVGNTLYVIDERIITETPENKNYVVSRSLIYELAKKIIPNFDIEEARNDPEFQNKVLYLAKIKNLLPQINRVELDSFVIPIDKNKLADDKIEETKLELLGQIEEYYDSSLFQDFKDDFILENDLSREELFANITALFVGFKTQLYRTLYNKVSPDEKSIIYSYKRANLSREHRDMIYKILQVKLDPAITKITNKLSATQIKTIQDIFTTSDNFNYVPRKNNLLQDMNLYKIRILVYIRNVLSNSEDIPVIRNLIDTAFQRMMSIFQKIFKTKEELKEYMAHAREQERLAVIKRDEIEDRDEAELNKVMKNLKLGIWGIGNKGVWNYDPDLFDEELRQQREYDRLAEQTNQQRFDGNGNFTLEMEEQMRENRARMYEEEETRIEGEAEED